MAAWNPHLPPATWWDNDHITRCGGSFGDFNRWWGNCWNNWLEMGCWMSEYARCYILALLADTIFADKSGDRVHTMWLQMLRDLRNPPQYSWGSACLTWLYRELCRATDRRASQIGGALLLVQYWAWVKFPFLCLRMDLPPDGAYGPPFGPSSLSIK